jgi:hypothetical protein
VAAVVMPGFETPLAVSRMFPPVARVAVPPESVA